MAVIRCWYDTVLGIALCDKSSWIVSVIIAVVIVTLITYICLKGGRREQDLNIGEGDGRAVTSAVKTCGLRYLYKHVYRLE